MPSFLKRWGQQLQAVLARILRSLGRLLWRAMSALVQGLRYLWPYGLRGIRWCWMRLQCLLAWFKKQIQVAWTHYQAWYAHSEDVKRFHAWQAGLMVRFEKKVIQFFQNKTKSTVLSVVKN